MPGLLASSGLGDAARYGNVLFVFSSCVLRRVVQHVSLLPAFAYPSGGLLRQGAALYENRDGLQEKRHDGTPTPPPQR